MTHVNKKCYNDEAETPNLCNYFGGNSMLKTNKKITQQELQELLSYDENTGLFIWKVKRGAVVKKGDIAGSLRKNGYISLKVKQVTYLAHRLAWLYTYGSFPRMQIDHIDGNKKNNTIHNLREVNNIENNKNRPISSNNTSGVMGVHWCNRDKRWIARININGKTVNLGSFVVFHEAVDIRKLAEATYDYHENHGRSL